MADAYLGDPNFERSAVLLTEHNKDGSLGFVLNKPLDIPLNKMLPDFPHFDAPVFNGGPVEKDHLYYIHNKGNMIPDSQLIRQGLYWGGDYEVLIEMVKNGTITSDDINFYLGYSGWNFGQIHDELKENSWSLIDADQLNVTDLRSEALWEQTLRNIGTEASYWHLAPEDPQWN